MFFPPKKLLVIRTRLAPEEVRQRLLDAIAKPRGLNFLAPRPELYIGSIKEDRFCIRRKGIAKNPYRPTISGEFKGDEKGSQVRLIMKPPMRWAVSLVFVIFVLGLAILNLFDLVVDASIGEFITLSRIVIALLVSTGLVALSYVLARGTLMQEYERATNYFCNLLESDDMQEMMNAFPNKAA